MRSLLAVIVLSAVACGAPEAPAANDSAAASAPSATTSASGTAPVASATTSSAAAVEESPESLLRALYEQHKPQQDAGISLDNEQQLSRFFSPELTALFMKDDACKQREQAVCNLDFDPIFAAQDFEDKPLDLAVEPMTPARYKVTFTNLGRRSLLYDVVQTPAGWRISDITYPEGESLKKLLSNPL